MVDTSQNFHDNLFSKTSDPVSNLVLSVYDPEDSLLFPNIACLYKRNLLRPILIIAIAGAGCIKGV